MSVLNAEKTFAKTDSATLEKKDIFEKKFASLLSVFSNVSLVILKIIAGVMTNSISVVSEAIHSFSDCVASILTFFAVSKSSKPADKDHPFGHGKYEDMSGFIEGGLIIFAGLYIIYEAALKLIKNNIINNETMLGIYVMVFSVFANLCVSSYLFYVAKKTDSVSIYADAQHLRVDIFSSLGILGGLVLIKYTGILIIDPIIAICVAAIIIKAGYSISKETLNNLLDGSLPLYEMDKIQQILCKNTSIRGYSNLKARKSGKYRDIELTVFFEPDLKLIECHKICDEVEYAIKQNLGSVSVIIHAEPLIYNP